MARGEVEYNYTLQEFPSGNRPSSASFTECRRKSPPYSSFGVSEPLLVTYMMLDLGPRGATKMSSNFPCLVRYHYKYCRSLADAQALLARDRGRPPRVRL